MYDLGAENRIGIIFKKLNNKQHIGSKQRAGYFWQDNENDQTINNG